MIKSWKFIAVAVMTAVLLNSNLAPAQAADLVDTAVAAGSFKTLAAALQAADLVDALKGKGPFTVFAPTDEAFAKLPQGTVETLLKPENKDRLVAILTYHVLAGKVPAKQVVSLNAATTLNGQRVNVKADEGRVTIDAAAVLKTDIECSNGVIHVIDSVILPSDQDLVATASKAGQFGTLLAAAKAAGLVDALTSAGPLTVFAPTDEAFANLPKGTVETLLKPANRDKLAAILKYHVVAGRVFSDEALKARTLETLQGDKLNVAVSDGKARVNNVNLVALDIDASNGVIHVIDTVLLPPAKREISAAEARRMIEHAVHRGVKLFNSGHHAACEKVYSATIEEMVGYEGQMPPLVMTSLKSALKKAESTHCPIQSSWTLRRSLDHAYHAMRPLDQN